MVQISSALRFSSADFSGLDAPTLVKTEKPEISRAKAHTWFIHTPQTKHPVNKSICTSHSFLTTTPTNLTNPKQPAPITVQSQPHNHQLAPSRTQASNHKITHQLIITQTTNHPHDHLENSPRHIANKDNKNNQNPSYTV